MKISTRSVLLGLATIWLAVWAIAAISASFLDVAMYLVFIASALVLVLGRRVTGHFTNLTFLFLTFLALYGLSGPVEILYGDGFLENFPGPYLVGKYLVLYCLSVIGVAIGLVIPPGFGRRAIPTSPGQWASADILGLSYLFALSGVVMEMINVLRAGGLGILLLGKAFAQSAVNDLTGTLPSTQFILLAAALLGLGLGLRRLQHNRGILRPVITWFLVASPVVSTYLVLGQRGILVSGVAVVVIGYYWNVPLKRVTPIAITCFLVLYVLMGALFGARSQIGFGVATGNWGRLVDRMVTAEYWVKNLNPASNEFGAPFGNVNTYLLSRERALRLGATYLKGLTVPIPAFVWPDKPKLAGYEFRDKFFPEFAARGRIAGTAFSSLLEAYMNFGGVGIVPIYSGIIIILAWLERKRTSGSGSLFYAVVYLTLLPTLITFHRSALDNPIVWPIIMSCVTVISYQILRSMKPPPTNGQVASLRPGQIQMLIHVVPNQD